MEPDPTPLPPHHLPGGRFRNPWPVEGGGERGFSAILRWQWQRLWSRRAPNPAPGTLPRGEPRIAHPRAAPGEIRATWVGHSTFLIQAGGLNLLTDPVWSLRASPSQRVGPARFTPPGIALDELPPIDAVLLSHDHYDHLDEPTARRLRDRFGSGLRWVTPLGYRELLGGWGVEAVSELDWGQTVYLGGAGGNVRVTCLPAQHWTRRRMSEMDDRLWASYAIELPDGRRIFFAGDSGYFSGFRETGEKLGPFDLSIIPIGAYEPRWFMRAAHMNPEEAVRTYRDLGGRGAFVGMHWGTFRLTDENPLEPPERTRAAWREAGLPDADLALLSHGETLVLGSGKESAQSAGDR
jgi:N-acyl-phosphatidylethanolamine-hydrolysing phospholipase D